MRHAELQRKSASVLLVAILSSNLILKFYGIGWGLPDGTVASHRTSNRGDENAILIDTLSVLRILQGNTDLINEHQFYLQEGWLGSYLRLAFLGTAYLTNYIHFDHFDDPETYDLVNFRRVFVISRLVSVLAATATIALVFLVGAKFWGVWEGLASALLTFSFPGFVALTYFAKSTALATLLSTVSLYLALTWHRKPRQRIAFLTGLLAGLAGGARTNAGLTILFFAVAFVLRWRSGNNRFRVLNLGSAIGGILLGLIITYPHLVLSPSIPNYGVGSVFYWGFKWRAFAQSLWLVSGFWSGVGLVLFGLISAGYRASHQPDCKLLILIVFIGLYFMFIAKTTIPQPRYFVPALPSLSIVVSVGLMSTFRQAVAGKSRLVSWASVLCVAALWLAVLAAGMSYVNVFNHEDTKVSASRWITENVASGTLIGKPAWEGDHRVSVDRNDHDIVYSWPSKDVPTLPLIDDKGQPEPEYLIVPEDQIPRNRFSMDAYRLVASYSRPLRAFGLTFDDRFAADDNEAPRWFGKFHATVRIYEHKPPQS
jgi:hypothetical protein